MASSPQVEEYLHIRLRMAKSRALQDEILDIINYNKTHATVWDAVMWGFSARWMRAGLLKLDANKPPCPRCGIGH